MAGAVGEGAQSEDLGMLRPGPRSDDQEGDNATRWLVGPCPAHAQVAVTGKYGENRTRHGLSQL